MSAAAHSAVSYDPDPNEIQDIPIEQLRLDAENPRFAALTDNTSQEGLLEALWTQMAVDEVALSIAENGYFRSEPLFVVVDARSPSAGPRLYTVIEGNRRLAAVLLLRDEGRRRELKITSLPSINGEARTKLDRLPAIVYPSREFLWTTVGFRHINGIKPWDSFSKAQYIARVHEEYGVELSDIAQRIGDRHATVQRLYRGYKVLEQAETQAGFDREDTAKNRFYFSHLYTATDQREYQDFLGLTPEDSLKPNPVPPDKLNDLVEFMTWLYGRRSTKSEPVVRTQNPDLNTLRKVISNPQSLSVLRRTGRLEVAFNVAVGDSRRFRDALTNSKVELQNAKATVSTGYAGDDDLHVTIGDIQTLSKSISSEMDGIRKAKPEKATKTGRKKNV